MWEISRNGEVAESLVFQGEGLLSKRARFLEVLAGEATLAKLSGRHEGQPEPVARWKRRAGEGIVAGLFGKQGRCQRRHEDHQGTPPNKRRQAVRRLRSASG